MGEVGQNIVIEEVLETTMTLTLVEMFLLAAVLLSLAGLVLIYRVTSNASSSGKREKERAMEEICQEIDDKWTFERELNLDLVREIQRAVEERNYVDLSTLSVLRRYLLHLSEIRVENPKIQEDRVALIMSLIAAEEKEEPFDQLPKDEQRLMRALLTAANGQEHEAFHYNLAELCTVITQRHRSHERHRRQNRWSVPLASVGLVLTVMTAVVAFSLTPGEEEMIVAFKRALVEHQREMALEKATAAAQLRLHPCSSESLTPVPFASYLLATGVSEAAGTSGRKRGRVRPAGP